MFLVVGLGNPESTYAGTRHNLGFELLEEFRKKVNAPEWSLNPKLKSEVIDLQMGNSKIILARPETYMNNSGMAVSLLVNYFKIPIENIIIAYDELDLPLGQIKVRFGGAAAGHHGVESVINALKTDKFIRLRLGIGNLRTQSGEHKRQHISAEKFVLENFLSSEKPKLKHMKKQALNALNIVLKEGLEKAQNQYN